MQFTRGVPKGSGLTASHITGNDTDGSQFQGIDKTFSGRLKAGKRVEVLYPYVLCKGFFLEAEECPIAHDCSPVLRRVFHPRIFSQVLVPTSVRMDQPARQCAVFCVCDN